MSEKTNRSQKTRRAVLRGIGASAATTVVAGTVSAQEGDSTPSAEEIGIQGQVDALLSEAKTEEAKALLSENNIDHSFTSQTIPIESDTGKEATSDETSPSVGTNSYFGKSTASADFGGHNAYGDDGYAFTLNWNFKDVSLSPDDTIPKDGVTIGWEDSNWSYEPGSVKMDMNGIPDKFDAENHMTLKNLPNLDSPGSALGVTVNDGVFFGNELSNEFTGRVTCRVTKEDPDVEATVAGQYTHTWTAIATGIANSIGFSPGSGALGISIDLPYGGTDKFELPKDIPDRQVKL